MRIFQNTIQFSLFWQFGQLMGRKPIPAHPGNFWAWPSPCPPLPEPRLNPPLIKSRDDFEPENCGYRSGWVCVCELALGWFSSANLGRVGLPVLLHGQNQKLQGFLSKFAITIKKLKIHNLGFENLQLLDKFWNEICKGGGLKTPHNWVGALIVLLIAY